MKKQVIFGIALALAILSCLPMQGQEKVVPLKYGNMDHWVIRNIKESAIIGGNQKTIYAVGPNMTIHGNTPYTNKGGSPWGSSNVLAHVSGIYKTNNSVYRDRHGSGYCAKLETHIEKVKVLGLINIMVQLVPFSWEMFVNRSPVPRMVQRLSTGVFRLRLVLRLCVSITRPPFLMLPTVSNRMDSVVPLLWLEETMPSWCSIFRSVTRMPRVISQPSEWVRWWYDTARVRMDGWKMQPIPSTMVISVTWLATMPQRWDSVLPIMPATARVRVCR